MFTAKLFLFKTYQNMNMELNFSRLTVLKRCYFDRHISTQCKHCCCGSNFLLNDDVRLPWARKPSCTQKVLNYCHGWILMLLLQQMKWSETLVHIQEVLGSLLSTRATYHYRVLKYTLHSKNRLDNVCKT